MFNNIQEFQSNLSLQIGVCKPQLNQIRSAFNISRILNKDWENTTEVVRTCIGSPKSKFY
jgi:hypothetical protein